MALEILFILLSLASVSYGWDYCYYSYYSYKYRRHETGYNYCDTSCCGYSQNRYCCSYDGTKAGAIVGGVICIAVIIGILACCLKSHYFRSRRVVRPLQSQPQVTSGNITIIQTPGMMAMPPPYSSYQSMPHALPTGPAPPYRPPSAAPPGYVLQSGDLGPTDPPPYTGPPPKY
ncbi:protein shisa-4-like [Mizuhopecten yessoensis]|uniref:Cysteine and tyrosine-rich protein 1 n=1 Tax=Mizuhopecten yessoensis TaxID=6573 RepID=A0A210QL84_MIZYE|nr:protein shisa-4-like [Mizuhopecten yessoensis]OWF49513.1 hypothetical protein KP79_PYT17503 [Mizuhopecten yessoensis]